MFEKKKRGQAEEKVGNTIGKVPDTCNIEEEEKHNCVYLIHNRNPDQEPQLFKEQHVAHELQFGRISTYIHPVKKASIRLRFSCIFTVSV